MPRKKLPIREQITITEVADGGNGLARLDGKVLFVENTVPGDVVDVQLNKKKSDYEMGYPVHRHQNSPLRVEPFCAHFETCGGCTWQNVAYKTQLQFKQQLVADAMRRIGKVATLPEIQPILASPHEKYYRNKLEFTFTHGGYIEGKAFDKEVEPERSPALGFHVRKKFAAVFNVDYCYLQPAPSNEIRLAIRSYGIVHDLPFFDLRAQKGYLRNIIIRNTTLGHLMVIVVVAEDSPELLFPMLEHLKQTFPEITSLQYCINTKQNDVIYDLDVHCFSGDPFITEQIGHVRYRLGPKSFFQTNTEQAKQLYAKTLELAALGPNDVVYDLYTGLGSIALLAAGACKYVTGVEWIEAAVEDARRNAEWNGISNCTFVSGDMAKVFTEDFIATHGKANVVITDPPRAGMHPDVCKMLLGLEPEKIIYVSCNPATQARDILLLSEKYHVAALQPVDMFPHTFHVENIALLVHT